MMLIENEIQCDGCERIHSTKRFGKSHQSTQELVNDGWVFEDPNNKTSVCICPVCKEKGTTIDLIYRKWWNAAD